MTLALVFGDNRPYPGNFWKTRAQSTIRLAVLILVCGSATLAAPPQAQPPSANQPEAAQTPAKPDNSKPEQQPSPASAASSPQQQPSASQSPDSSNDQKTKQQKSSTSNDRLFWTFPNFATVQDGQHLPPLTAGEKFKLVARSTLDPVEFGFIGVVTLIDQAENTEPAYGQGVEGYAKRYATNFADTVVENFMVGAVFPSVLRQDPRYYRSGKGSFLRRTGYAISRIVITRSDSGHTQFNFSEVLGSAFAAGVSTYAYHPQGDKTLPNTASVWGTQLALDSISNMLKEFWPDIRRKLLKGRQRPDPPSSGK
ncbi:MAG: hypothetical protein WB780_23155 [Candidatus Acidiferrales bacterium]